MKDSENRGGLLSDEDPINSSLVEVMEDKHEMFQVRGNASQDMDQMDMDQMDMDQMEREMMAESVGLGQFAVDRDGEMEE